MKRNEIRVINPPYFKKFQEYCAKEKRSMNKQVHILIEKFIKSIK